MDLLISKTSKVIQDIDHCLNLKRVDEQMNWFMHIFQMLDEDSIKPFNVDKLRNKISKYVENERTRRLIDYYYTVANSEAAYILFAEQYVDSDVYDLDSGIYKVNKTKNVYTLINEIQLDISKHLGLVKNHLLSKTFNLEDQL